MSSFLLQDPVQGTKLHLVVISLHAPPVRDSFSVFPCFLVFDSLKKRCPGALSTPRSRGASAFPVLDRGDGFGGRLITEVKCRSRQHTSRSGGRQ